MTALFSDVGPHTITLKSTVRLTCCNIADGNYASREIKQHHALISPHFLDISARSSKLDFAEPDPETEAKSGRFYYSPPINLQLWSVDNEKGLATSCSPLEWASASALPVEGDETD